jgi:hypothetical protein
LPTLFLYQQIEHLREGISESFGLPVWIWIAIAAEPERGQRSDREDQADVELYPRDGSQVDGDKRAPTGLDDCHEGGNQLRPRRLWPEALAFA